jgi:RNA polymerase sigma-54 factor
LKPNQNLTINLVQKLALTPDLLQSLSVLQMSFMELETYLSCQLSENCMLEQDESEPSEEAESEIVSENTPESLATYEQLTQFDDDFGEMPRLQAKNETIRSEIPNPSVLSLQEHLIFQLHLANLPPAEGLIAEYLIGNIDDDGYLRCGIQETAEILKTSVKMVENSLGWVQTCDPAGVGARHIEECLTLQIRAKCQAAAEKSAPPPTLMKLAQTLATGYLQDIADGKLAKIAAKLKTPLAEIQAAVDFIRTLDPKPGRNFGDNREIRFIIPDVTIRRLGSGYQVTVNEPPNARLSINPFFRWLDQNKSTLDADAVKFIKDKQNAALQILKWIEQRRSTLFQVTESIIHFQNDFLGQGMLRLKPLTLRQVAAALGIHESTVSRAIAGKYLDTPQGIYPFKFFFTAGLDASGGEQVAAGSVKKLIKTAVIEEDPQSPLSDQRLMELLKEKNITISRRTVAKYREEMLIPSSEKRRRY